MAFLFFMACGFVTAALAALWGNWRDGSAERARAAGRAVGVPAEVSWPEADGRGAGNRRLRGDLWLAADAGLPVRFVSDSAVLTVAPGGRIADVVPSHRWGTTRLSFGPCSTVLYELPGTGRVLGFTVPRPAAGTVSTALTAPVSEGSPRHVQEDALRVPLLRRVRVPRVAAVLLSCALALGIFGAHTFALGREVTARVTGVRGDSCRVTWQDPWDGSRDRHASVDCYAQRKPGDTLRVSARPWPVRGEAADLEDSPFMTAVGVAVTGAGGLAGTLAATAGYASRLRRLRTHLRTGDGPSGTTSRTLVVPWWSWAAGTVGVTGLCAVALAYGFGRPVEAEVTRVTEYGCAVTWADPWDGARRTAEVDCEGAARGDRLDISALPWPLRGEAFDRDLTPVALGLATFLGPGIASAGIVYRTRRARRANALAGLSALPPAGDAGRPAARATPRARPDDVLARDHLAAVSALLLARTASGHGGKRRPAEPGPGAGPWWRSPALRRVAARSGISWGALIALAVIGGLSGEWWLTTARLATDAPVAATARVQLVHRGLPSEPWLLPATAEIGFTTADGRSVVTDIAVAGPVPAEGATVRIEYAPGAPSAARIPGDPGLTRGLWVSATAASLALGRAVWCAVAAGRTLRRVLRAARSSPAGTFDYLVLPDGEETVSEPPMLLLFEPGADRPAALLYVEPGALHLPPWGTARLHRAAGDPWAVAFVEGRPVWPTSPLFDLTDEEEAKDLRAYVEELVPPGVTPAVETAGGESRAGESPVTNADNR